MRVAASRPFLGLGLLDAEPEAVAALLAARPAGAPFAYLVTPNADHFVRLAQEQALRPLYEQAAWRTLDSRAVALAARLLGLASPAVAPGADILAALLEGHVRQGDRLTVIGLCLQGVAVLRLRLPGVEIAHHLPPPGLAGDPAACRAAVAFALAHPARFTLFAVGSPLQESLALSTKSAAGATGAGLCIGAGLDFWTGVTPRAPRWMRRAGLEWTFRLFQDPERLWRRYLVVDPAILRFLLAERSQSRGRRGVRWPAGPPV
ncbi:MAG TPA: WecB/TagA/CpsF family glycosyltransferase [Acidisoma sp.]|uniref:WecB/TagA/CpsF family glycosyltransferase n=1 Tax=Acidisoma sp. TaxID=1872115 RepID=UPI002D025A35|nr:WecB/TagA/CpsF family glycosyltransferase [Acidisoma sp.]HTI01521.1 WecB/TagA/CpsF family glycosyltransferase [Acidisoma sp.]